MGRSNGGSGGRTTATRVLNLIERRCLAPVLKRNDDVRERERSSYQKLHQLPLLNLSVLKLDGSLFEIHVGRTATIAELKQAVEEVFGSFQGKIPWSLVWGHFCLCYVDQKLTNDKACIRVFGIKDGDQLQFIRHMSISNSPLERRSKNGSVPYIQYPKFKYGHEEEEKSGLDAIQEDSTEYYSNGDMEEGHVPEVKVSHFFRGLLSYSKVIGGIKKGIRKQESFFEFPTFRRKRV